MEFKIVFDLSFGGRTVDKYIIYIMAISILQRYLLYASRFRPTLCDN